MQKFFELEHKCKESRARAAVLHTDHGDIQTPIFMPVGTQGSVKAIEQRELIDFGAQIILGNTYHLYLRPGNGVMEHFGGLHKFINWDRAILTDSGGYQVFSLKELRKLTEDGVEFRSYIDGSKHFFSPENVVETQKILGSDIVMVLDECTPYPATEQEAVKSIELSIKWAARSKQAFVDQPMRYGHRQFLFGIGQGSMYSKLRRDYLHKLIDIGFDGYAIGGLSVGEPAEMMYEMTEICTEIMPEDKPRYLMGVGTPQNILESIERGIDMFDCVMPTRNARNGQLFTTRGRLNIRNQKHKLSEEAIDPGLSHYASRNFSLGYLRHLLMSNEILGLQLASQQNIAFYLWLVRQARRHIIEGDFPAWKKEFLLRYEGDEE